jgi:hypothetical protein
MRIGGRQLSSVAWLVLAALATAGARAWEVVPRLRIAADANDNPRLLSDDAIQAGTDDETASRLIAEARFELANVTPRSEFEFEPAIRTDRYADEADRPLESTDTYLRGAGQRRWERAALGFNMDFAHEKILGAEALNMPTNPDDPAFDDGILLGINERRTRAVFSPYTEIELGERGTARLDLRALDVSYDDPTMLTTHLDYTDWEAGAAYIRRLTSRSTVSGRIFGSRYEVEANGNVTNTEGVEIDVARNVSDVWSVAATVGYEYIEFTYLDATAIRVRGKEDGFVLGLSLRKRTELASVDFDLRRRTNPDSFGFLSQRSELVATFLRDLSPKLTGGFVIRAIANEPLRGIVATARRDFGRVELNLEWAFAELWSLSTAYEHAAWKTDEIDRAANSDSLVVGFNYRGRSRRSAAD